LQPPTPPPNRPSNLNLVESVARSLVLCTSSRAPGSLRAPRFARACFLQWLFPDLACPRSPAGLPSPCFARACFVPWLFPALACVRSPAGLPWPCFALACFVPWLFPSLACARVLRPVALLVGRLRACSCESAVSELLRLRAFVPSCLLPALASARVSGTPPGWYHDELGILIVRGV
jgi:hypothetical protein